MRAAQTIAGELLWVMTRSRPDICFATSFMTRLLHKRPSYVVELGKHVLRYLAGSKSMGLMFENGQREADALYIKTDTSFAPPLAGYRSIQGTALYFTAVIHYSGAVGDKLLLRYLQRKQSWLGPNYGKSTGPTFHACGDRLPRPSSLPLVIVVFQPCGVPLG